MQRIGHCGRVSLELIGIWLTRGRIQAQQPVLRFAECSLDHDFVIVMIRNLRMATA
jgi:hypothetical protein